MKKTVQIVLIVVLFLMLISVRAFVEPYFYDPLIFYFKSDYLHTPIPHLNLGNYFLNLCYRYCLNTAISLAIIYLIYNNLKALIFSVKFYVFAFIILGVGLFILLKFDLGQGYRLTFYIRRFLIHPLFLLILLPAFYYQKVQLEERNS